MPILLKYRWSPSKTSLVRLFNIMINNLRHDAIKNLERKLWLSLRMTMSAQILKSLWQVIDHEIRRAISGMASPDGRKPPESSSDFFNCWSLPVLMVRHCLRVDHSGSQRNNSCLNFICTAHRHNGRRYHQAPLHWSYPVIRLVNVQCVVPDAAKLVTELWRKGLCYQ